MPNNIGKNLKILRMQKGITQQELAEQVGKKMQMVGLWERGKRGIGVNDLIKLSKYFGVTIDQIVMQELQLTIK